MAKKDVKKNNKKVKVSKVSKKGKNAIDEAIKNKKEQIETQESVSDVIETSKTEIKKEPPKKKAANFITDKLKEMYKISDNVLEELLGEVMTPDELNTFMELESKEKLSKSEIKFVREKNNEILEAFMSDKSLVKMYLMELGYDENTIDRTLEDAMYDNIKHKVIVKHYKDPVGKAFEQTVSNIADTIQMEGAESESPTEENKFDLDMVKIRLLSEPFIDSDSKIEALNKAFDGFDKTKEVSVDYENISKRVKFIFNKNVDSLGNIDSIHNIISEVHSYVNTQIFNNKSEMQITIEKLFEHAEDEVDNKMNIFKELLEKFSNARKERKAKKDKKKKENENKKKESKVEESDKKETSKEQDK